MEQQNPWSNFNNPWEEGLALAQDTDGAPPVLPGSIDRLDFREAIAQNRRNTTYLVIGMLALAFSFGYVLGWAWDITMGRSVAAGMSYMATNQIDWRTLVLTPAPTGIMLGLSMLAAMAVWSLFAFWRADKMVLSMANAHESDPARLPQLHNVIEEVAIAAGIPKPKVYIMPTSMPNAFATGLRTDKAAVGITSGLLERLNRRELQAVMAHEVGHIINGDMRYATLMAVMTGVLVFVAQMVLQSRRFFYYGGSHQRRGRGGHPILFVVMIVVFLVTAILVPILAKLIQMAISRQREYLADATAVKLTRDPGGLISALQKIAASNEPAPRTNSALEPLFIVTPAQMLQNGHKAWFSTHPPMEKRLERLKALE